MIRRAASAFVTAWLILTNRYEAGQRGGTSRSWLPGFVQDARFDADCATRLEIVRKARYFERNNGILNQLADLFEQFTVGPNGLQFVPSSTDEDWNQAAQEWWDEWQKVCDLTSLHSFGTIQSLVARSWFIDGEIFILKTYGQDISVKPGQPTRRPRIQLIESHRVETPANLYHSRNIYDGVELDANGRPIAYYVRDTVEQYASEYSYRRIPADQIIHIFEPSRPGQLRGLPFCYPVLNDLHDLDDLQMLEMLAAKDAAEKSTIVENTAGESSPDKLIRDRFSATTKDAQGNDVDQTRQQHLKKILGGRTVFLKRGEKATQWTSDRPNVTTRDYWDYLAAKVCIGHGIPHLLVFPHSLQGTVVRGEYDKANAFFQSRSAVLISGFRRIYEWAIGWATQNDIRLSDPPTSWYSAEVLAPRSVNVDVGRESAAMLAELEAGATTYHDIYSPLGENWKLKLRQKAIEAKYIRSLATEFTLDPSEISTKQVDRPERFETIQENTKQRKQQEEIVHS